MSQPGSFEAQFSIRWADLDANRHVRNTIFSEFATHTRFRLLEANGFPQARFESLHFGPVMFREEIRYRRELVFGDEATVSVIAAGLSDDGSQWRVHQEVTRADGKQAAVLRSEGEKQAAINKAQGDATAIRVIAEATAAGERADAEAIGDKGGLEAANLKVAQQYIDAFANLAKTSNTLIVPTSASDVAGFLATAMTVLDRTRQAQAAAKA